MKNILIFESHSTSLDNKKKITSGHLDPPLSKKGRKQAKDLGLRYKISNISIVYCSDLQRSFETAEIAFRTRDISIIRDYRLREWNYGDFNGHPASEIEEMKPSYISNPFPGGESLSDAVKRISYFVQLLLKKHENILIIGHRAVYYTLEHLFNKISFEDLLMAQWHWQPGWVYQKQKIGYRAHR